jgi:uncharacterized Zn finger protein (UPF0148 family)
VNDIPNILFYRFDAACDLHGEVVTGLKEGLEYQCPECGTFFPASTMRCPVCRTEYKEEEETVEEIIEEFALPLKDDVKEAEEDNKASREEIMRPPEKDFNMEHRTSTRVSKKVIYKKVRDKSP